MGGFLLDGDSISVFVEFHNAKALGVVDIITENSCSFALLCFLNGCAESFPKTVACKNIVPQYHGCGISVDKFFADGECLGESVRRGLGLVGKIETELVAVPEEDFESRQILRRGDDQDVADSCVHQYRNRIIDHRFVVDREQLFGCDHSQRIESGAGSAGENYAFHG